MVARSFRVCEDGKGRENVRAEPSCLGVSDMVAVGRLVSCAFASSSDVSVVPASACCTVWLSARTVPSRCWLECCFASAMRLSKSGFCAKYFLMASSSVGDETAGLAGGMGTFFFGGMRVSLATQERQRLLI